MPRQREPKERSEGPARFRVNEQVVFMQRRKACVDVGINLLGVKELLKLLLAA